MATKSIFDWEHMLCYASGAMDFAADRGCGWRDMLIEKLVAIGIPKERILNPCNKPLSTTHRQLAKIDEGELMAKHRKEKNWDGLTGVMKQLAHFDLRMVDKSDFLIAGFPKFGRDPFEESVAKFEKSYASLRDFVGRTAESAQARDDLKVLRQLFLDMVEQMAEVRVPTYGTMHEIVVARQQKKPVFTIWEGDGMTTCSGWLAWLVGHKYVFRSIDSCVNRIDRIMHRKESVDPEDWLLFELPEEG